METATTVPDAISDEVLLALISALCRDLDQ
jgi:hypothetical protein